MKNVLFLTSYASPYRVRFFDELGKKVNLTVLFSDRKEDQTHRTENWFINGQGNYRAVQLQKKVWGVEGRLLCLDVLKWLNKKWDAIIICGYSGPTAILAMCCLSARKIPFYLEVDGGLIRPDTGFKFRIKKWLVTRASAWLGSGKATKQYLIHYGANADAVYTYPFSSLSENEIRKTVVSHRERLDLRKELSITEEHVILSVGQFIHRKGFDVLMKAAAILPDHMGIYIVGGQPTEEYLQMRSQLGLSNVHFVGFKSKIELLQYYKASDLFVLPTREDIWGLVINEAMACGLPVVTTDRCVAGMELVEDEINGYLCPADDEVSLAEKIQAVFDGDPSEMGEASLKRIAPYTIENMAKIHLEILEKGEKIY